MWHQLAVGGTATIHLASRHGESPRRPVALKRLLPQLVGRSEYVAMLEDEAYLSGLAAHPNVRKILGLERAEDGETFLVMEFLLGAPLADVMATLAALPAYAPAPPVQCIVAHIIAEIADALHVVHCLTVDGAPLNVVHRDVSPQNLFVLQDGSVRLTDFGIAWSRVRRQPSTGRALKGKFSYMAPEYLERRPYDGRSDVWSLGVVLWELLTAKRLFRRASDAAVVEAVRTGRIPNPSDEHGTIDPALDEIVRGALQRDPAARYESAASFSAALRGFVSSKRGTVGASDVSDWLLGIVPQAMEDLSRLTRSIGGDGVTVDRSGFVRASGTWIATDEATMTEPSRLSGSRPTRTRALERLRRLLSDTRALVSSFPWSGTGGRKP